MSRQHKKQRWAMKSPQIRANTPMVEYYVLETNLTPLITRRRGGVVGESHRRDISVWAKWRNESGLVEAWWCAESDFLRLARWALWLWFWQEIVGSLWVTLRLKVEAFHAGGKNT